MKRTWYQLNGMDEFLDVDGTVDRPCYGIFPAEDTAQEVAEYFATIGIETKLIEVEADWSKAIACVLYPAGYQNLGSRSSGAYFLSNKV